MIATQLLLCQGLAMPTPKTDSLPVMCSPRGVLLEIRREISGRTRPRNRSPQDLLGRNANSGSAQHRRSPGHGLVARNTGPQPPVLLGLTRDTKDKIQAMLSAT